MKTTNGVRNYSNLCFDAKTLKLLELTRTQKNQQEKVDDIIDILNLKCPKLLEGLCRRRTKNVVSQLQIKCFARDEVVFHQNDIPDAYYTVIRGAVSIYAQNSTATGDNKCNESVDEDNYKSRVLSTIDRTVYGKFLVQLPPGSGFGELSFNADGNHSRRSAGVISDGNHGQSKVYSDDNQEYIASDVAVLLLIPREVYLAEMFGRDINKHQTKEKVDFLKSSFVFSVWSVDQLVFLSYEMRKLDFSAGHLIVEQGDKNETIWIIKSGSVQISVKVEKRGTKSPKKKLVDIATLSANDVFGIVEALDGSSKMRCNVKSISDVELFVISSKALISFLPQVPRTRLMFKKVARNRVSWEELRIDFARKFPDMKLNLTSKFQKSMSDYQLSQKMALTDSEIRQRKKRSLVLFKCLRDARASYRLYLNKRQTAPMQFVQQFLSKAEDCCIEALIISKEIDDSQRYVQADDLLSTIKSSLSEKHWQHKESLSPVPERRSREETITNIFPTCIPVDDYVLNATDTLSMITDDESEFDVNPSNKDFLLRSLATKAGIRIHLDNI